MGLARGIQGAIALFKIWVDKSLLVVFKDDMGQRPDHNAECDQDNYG